ncbi:hypothetical protein [Deinococcus ruber]|uniref:Uncharacterized protein n=1 Tax=Deinococcus ruber TaxID=1848197 RepID=A0A918F7S2_9DEIO|nr:hypothetical protein [Deinococcus ruber]GGR09324.1 hypothetical protein GCM10008957_22530 [Deinococcus ruber]
MKKLLTAALTLPTALVFTDVALKYGLHDAAQVWRCVLSSGLTLSATPALMVGGAMLGQHLQRQAPSTSLQPA